MSSAVLPCASWPPPAPPQLVTSITLGNPNSASAAVYAKEEQDEEEESRRERKKRRRRSRSRSREDRRSRRKRSRSKHKKHRKSRRRRSSSESSWSSDEDLRRKRKRQSQSPEVIAIRSPEVISLSPEASPRVGNSQNQSKQPGNSQFIFLFNPGLSIASASIIRAACYSSDSEQDDRGSQS